MNISGCWDKDGYCFRFAALEWAVEHFKRRHKQQIDNLKRAFMSDDDRATRLIDRHYLGMRHVERAAISQMNSEGLERPTLMKPADLINSHR